MRSNIQSTSNAPIRSPFVAVSLVVACLLNPWPNGDKANEPRSSECRDNSFTDSVSRICTTILLFDKETPKGRLYQFPIEPEEEGN